MRAPNAISITSLGRFNFFLINFISIIIFFHLIEFDRLFIWCVFSSHRTIHTLSNILSLKNCVLLLLLLLLIWPSKTSWSHIIQHWKMRAEHWKIHWSLCVRACIRKHRHSYTQAIHTNAHFFDFFRVLMVMNACVTLCVNYLLTERIFFSRFFLFIICQCIRQNKWIRFSFADIKWIQRGIYGRIFIHAFISTSLIYFFQAENNSAFILAAIQICFMCAMRWYDFTSHFNL